MIFYHYYFIIISIRKKLYKTLKFVFKPTDKRFNFNRWCRVTTFNMVMLCNYLPVRYLLLISGQKIQFHYSLNIHQSTISLRFARFDSFKLLTSVSIHFYTTSMKTRAIETLVSYLNCFYDYFDVSV